MASRARWGGGRLPASGASFLSTLDPDAHRRLLQAAAAGSRTAQEALIEAHLELVSSAARERAGGALPAADLCQEGSLGLLDAISQFPDSGRDDFEEFARDLVGRQMDRALAEEAVAEQVNRGLVAAAEDYERAEASLHRELGREARPEDLAERLEWSRERTAQVALLVQEARRRHDEELLPYLDGAAIDLERLLEERPAGEG